MNILITGCGGDLSFSIGKILKKNTNYKLFGCDIKDIHAGNSLFSECFVVQVVSCDHYYYDINKIIKNKNINLIIPASEPEIEYFQNNKDKFDVPILMCCKRAHDIFKDKYLTYSFLKDNNLPYPDTKLLGEYVYSEGQQIMIKPRQGCGNKKNNLVDDSRLFNYILDKIDKTYIFQEYIYGPEYTCCIFRSHDKKVYSIVFERELSGGISIKGKVVDIPEINNLLVNIANLVDLEGSINVQLRMKNNIPYVFEINPRFSSTVRSRHLLGFKDLMWSIYSLDPGFMINDYKKCNVNSRFFVMPEQYVFSESNI